MKFRNVGASRRASHSARLTAANELVQRTLTQHGLVSHPEQTQGVQSSTVPSIRALWSRQGASPSTAEHVVKTPDSDRFSHDTFSCASGSREFRTYVPVTAADGATGVVVMLHGCTQSPEDFATGTGMNRLADKHRFIVVYPAQSRRNNTQSCWNWFSRGDQMRGRGEPAIIAAMTQQVCRAHGVARDRTFVAGLSAGAAMAVILGETYPDIFARVGVHSGLAYGAAKDVPSAFAVMAGHTSKPLKKRTSIPTIVFHGSSDATVHPSNGDAVAGQVTAEGPSQTVETTHNGQSGGRSFSVRRCTSVTGEPTLEYWTIEGLGHAWSGGQSDGSYADPKGPDASAEMVRFFFDLPKSEL